LNRSGQKRNMRNGQAFKKQGATGAILTFLKVIVIVAHLDAMMDGNMASIDMFIYMSLLAFMPMIVIMEKRW